MEGVVRVLIADDHPLYRTALSELFERDQTFALLGAVADLPAALDLLHTQCCELVILDLHMPGMDGFAGIVKVRQCCPTAKIALISGDIDEATVTAGLRAGATGFLPKSFDHDIILAAVKLIVAGGVYVPHDLRPSGDAALPVAEEGGEGKVVLSARELEILHLMARGATHKEIGRALGIAEVTVKLHTQRIVRKLAVKNRSAAIAKAVKEKLIEPP